MTFLAMVELPARKKITKMKEIKAKIAKKHQKTNKKGKVVPKITVAITLWKATFYGQKFTLDVKTKLSYAPFTIFCTSKGNK